MREKLGAAHWLARAEEARRLAERMGNENARREMLLIAVGYEKLAAFAVERTAAGISPPDSEGHAP